MKLGKMLGLFGLSPLALCAADPIVVHNASELYAALSQPSGTYSEIRLEKGNYDVSAYTMFAGEGSAGAWTLMPAHLYCGDSTKLVGLSDNPRDVVIYGDHTKGVFRIYRALLRNLTVSNGYAKASATYGAGVSDTEKSAGSKTGYSTCSNLVVTCCDNPGGEGGGLGGAATCYNCEACFNTAAKGAGFASVGNGYDCYLHDNFATSQGGGAFGGKLTRTWVIDNCITNTSAAPSGFGGGVAYVKPATSCLIAGNRSWGDGGGAANSTLVSCIVSNNVAGAGGGGLSSGSATDSDIVFNVCSNEHNGSSSSQWARGAGANDAALTRCLIAGNAIPICNSQMFGGGAYGSTLTKCQVINNFAKFGAAVNGGSLTSCVISNNASVNNGSRVIRGTTSLTDCDIHDVVFDSPGAMYDCRIWGGTGATLTAGANVYTSGVFNLYLGTFISSTQSTHTFVTNCLFTGCVADSFISGSSAGGHQAPFVNCTVVSNAFNLTFDNMTGTGAGSLELVNCIFAENLSRGGVRRDFYPHVVAGGTNVTIRNCLIPNGLDGMPSGWQPKEVSGLVTGEARFCKEKDPENPFSIRHSSPARTKGLKMDWMTGATDVRHDATYPRLKDNLVDIGCYQCWLDAPGLLLMVR